MLFLNVPFMMGFAGVAYMNWTVFHEMEHMNIQEARTRWPYNQYVVDDITEATNYIVTHETWDLGVDVQRKIHNAHRDVYQYAIFFWSGLAGVFIFTYGIMLGYMLWHGGTFEALRSVSSNRKNCLQRRTVYGNVLKYDSVHLTHKQRQRFRGWKGFIPTLAGLLYGLCVVACLIGMFGMATAAMFRGSEDNRLTAKEDMPSDAARALLHAMPQETPDTLRVVNALNYAIAAVGIVLMFGGAGCSGGCCVGGHGGSGVLRDADLRRAQNRDQELENV